MSGEVSGFMMASRNGRKKIVKEYYSRRASEYDNQKTRTWGDTTGFSHEVFGEVIGFARAIDGLALDVGVGSGRVSLALIKETNLRLIGLDLSEEMICKAKEKMNWHLPARNGPDLVLGDAEFLPFRGDSFSLLLCISMLHYLTSPENVFAESRRVLRDHGGFVCGDVTIHEMDNEGFVDTLERLISNAHARYYRPSAMRELLETKVIKVYRVKTFPYSKTYTSLIEGKAKYFDVEPQRLQEFVAKANDKQKTIYEINGTKLTLYYTIITGFVRPFSE